MKMNPLLESKRDDILRIAADHGAREVCVFGSFARGEEKPESDIDFLVKAGEKTSAWFPTGLIMDLEALLGRKVDVVTEDSIYWLLRHRILKEARPL
ncbi:MAG: nucleotidyltransferase family protein [Candidatus Sumerlaeota bacterium]|nr:nucleotidyltransferase family protein [Candidatus Sumerlaeota bacterium]